MRILIIEDDQSLGEGLKKDLGRLGFVVDVVNDGVDGEHMGDVEPYDAVVLDLGLPRKSGLEILHAWRHRGNKVPVIVLTARDAWHQKVDGFKAGADDYLGKPFHTEELAARLSAIIRRSAGEKTGGMVENFGVKLDEERQVVLDREGVPHQLTGTEFRLLRYLMLHPGRLMSKSRLSEHVYEYDEDKDSNVIEVYIRRLRTKVGADLIHTRRGQGYIFGSHVSE
ncbi:MAG: response regulator transcription factor [Gammaproteobacteria bacterium]|nr:response regulator transcription factor [Gammaproteobacteria bacterium]